MYDVIPFIHKHVSFTYLGHELGFALSHALFSSYDIDTGSRLLLKTLAPHITARRIRSIADIGSGVGVLGIACAKLHPDAALVMRDRDSLACAFSLHNARKNGIEPEAVDHALFLEGLQARRFDLVLCNVPAKAGAPVLDAFIRNMPRVLSDSGCMALVVVEPIAEAARASIAASGAVIAAEERASKHRVFICERGSVPAGDGIPVPFVRCSRRVQMDGGSYPLDGYWGLPEFDSAGFDSELLRSMYDSAVAGLMVRRACVIEPGVGLFACHCAVRSGPYKMSLCSRDALSLRAASENARKAAASVCVETFSDSAALPAASFDMLAERPDIVPLLETEDAAWRTAARVLKKGGTYIASGPSHYMEKAARKKPKCFTRIAEKKRKGYVCCVWRFEGGAEDP